MTVVRAALLLALIVAQAWVGSDAAASPPTNDTFSGATHSPRLAFLDITSNLEAGTEAFEPTPSCSGTRAATVWYRLETRPDLNLFGTVFINTLGSEFDTVLAVYRGSILPNLVQVACNDNYRPAPPGEVAQSGILLDLAPNEVYYVQVGGKRWFERGRLVFQVLGSDARDATLDANRVCGGIWQSSGSCTLEVGDPVPARGFVTLVVIAAAHSTTSLPPPNASVDIRLVDVAGVNVYASCSRWGSAATICPDVRDAQLAHGTQLICRVQGFPLGSYFCAVL